MLLKRVINVLSNDKPIGSDRVLIGLSGRGAHVVSAQLAPQVYYGRNARSEAGLRKEEVRLYFFNHWLIGHSLCSSEMVFASQKFLTEETGLFRL